jgi:starvation-inducible DNA-binding protein
MALNIGLKDAQRKGVIGLLKPLLADEYVLYTKTRNYHWNVTGPHFHDLHKFFESQYDALDGKIDDIAEFIRSLGEKSPGSLAEFLSRREGAHSHTDGRGPPGESRIHH